MSEQMRERAEAVQIPIETLSLSDRVLLILHCQNIDSVQQLVAHTEDSLRTIPGLKEQDLGEISVALGRFGLGVGEDFAISPGLQRAVDTLPGLFWRRAGQTSLAALELPTRVHNALTRAGITSVEGLVRHTEAELWDVRNFGQGAMAVLKETLAHLGLQLREPHQECLEEPARNVATWPARIDDRASRPIEIAGHIGGDIPIEVLGLPARPYHALRHNQIYSIEELVRLSEQDILRIRSLGQGSLQQIQTVLGQVGLSLGEPMTITAELQAALNDFRARSKPRQLGLGLPESSLDQVASYWFSNLSKEQVQVLVARYGIKDTPLGLEETAQSLGETVREVFLIEVKALREVERKDYRSFLHPLIRRLRDILAQAGGLITDTQLASILRDNYQTDEIQPIGVARLVMKICEHFARVPGEATWGLVDRPLSFVPVARQLIASALDGITGPIAQEQLLAQVKQLLEQYEYAESLADDFLTACVRTDPQIQVAEDGMCFPRGNENRFQTSLQEPPLDLLMDTWLNLRGDKDREVIWNRYGLGDGQQRTLEECGQVVGVTRERVRQIQKRCLKDLAHPSKMGMVGGVVGTLLKAMRLAGNLMTEKEIGQYLASVYRVERVNPVAAGRLMLLLSRHFKEVVKGYLWGVAEAPLDLVQNVQREMESILDTANLPLSPRQVVARFKGTVHHERKPKGLDDGFIVACLRTHSAIELDARNRCALTKWSKKRLDEIVQALHEIGRPSHFMVITERANTLLPADQQTSARTVHAYMDRRIDVFIGLGRGIYWLRDHVANDEAAPQTDDFGIRFAVLARWQAELEGRDKNVGHNTHAEVETIRRVGLDFFAT